MILINQNQLPVYFIKETNKHHTILIFLFSTFTFKTISIWGKMKKKILAGLKGNTQG